MGNKKIVMVGTDGSKTSFRAVSEAAKIATERGATLLLVSVYSQPDPHTSAWAKDELREESYMVSGSFHAEEVLQDAVAVAKKAGATDIDTHAVPGEPVPALAKVARDRDVDLLVVGDQGLKGLAGRVLGSVPAGLPKKARCKVEVVKTS
jgi:nucleotide-binding universal stress UspA family protein